ncbi:MAG: PaaI family thioesterase [Bacilli bacterium]|nr:PaaI family thioesterase [Bacilli bacterium]
MKNEKMLEKLVKENGFFLHNHYQVEKIDEEEVILKAELKEEAMNPYEMAHGAFLFGLGDTAMGILVAKTGRKGVTLNSDINFLKPGRGAYVEAKSKIIKNGKKTAFAEAKIYDEEESLVAVMTANYYYIEEGR